jgi:hypothetical protein
MDRTEPACFARARELIGTQQSLAYAELMKLVGELTKEFRFFLHRFGSALNPHFHFHLVVLDGLCSEDPDGSVHFHEASDPGTRDIRRLQQMVRRRVLRLYRRRELLDKPTVATMLTWQCLPRT